MNTYGTRQKLIEEADSMPWFHAIDFGDYTSPGRFPQGTTPNSTLLPVFHFLRDLDVTDRDCLDIGTADGIVAFSLKQQGARRVVGADGGPRRQFEIARQLLGIDVEYDSKFPDTEFDRRFPPGTFDVVVMAGLIYHLFGPLNAIAACRNMLRPGGILITETVYIGGDQPKLLLNTELEPPIVEQQSTYFLPTKSAIEGMLKLSCFDVVASASVGRLVDEGGRGRISHIARAVRPSDVQGRTPQLLRTHALRATPQVSFQTLENQTVPASAPMYRGESDKHVALSSNLKTDWLPLQPQSNEVPRKSDATDS